MNIKEYSEISGVIASNTMGFTNSISRGKAIPLDQSSIFESLAAAKTYVNDAGIAYEGQIIAVKEGNFQNVYVLDKSAPDGLRKLASDTSSQASFSCTISALETATDGALKSYQLYQGGAPVEGAVIDIPKDYLVKKAEIKVCEANDNPLAGLKVGDKYLDFVINSKDSAGEDGTHLYINLHDLTDVYTGGNTSTIKITVASDNTITASIVEKSIHLGLLSTDVTDKFDGLRTDVNTLTSNLANEIKRATDAEGAIAATLKTVSADYLTSADNEKLTNAIDTAKTEASTALSNLSTEIYTSENGLSAKLHKEVTDAAATAKNNADKALTDAKAYTNEVSAALSTDYVGKIKDVSDQITALTSNLDTNYLKIEVANSPTTDDKLMKRTEVEAKIAGLDVATTELGTGKTIKTIGEEDGKISVQIQDIQITKSQVTDLTSDLNTINTAIGGLTAISASQDGKIKTLETSVGTLMADESTSGSVKAQVKAEADRAKGVESALAATLSTVSSDYLKSEVETDLQGKIDKINTALTGDGGYDSRIIANANAISTLNGDASIEGSVDKKIKDSLAGLANAMHFRGVVTRGEGQNTDQAAIDAQITNPIDGDVVVVTDSSKEYVYDGTNKKWIELGDETLYATNAKLTAEAEARAAADTFLSGKISVLIGTGDGSVSKALADAKAYADGISTTLSGDYDKKIAAEAKRAGDAEKVLSSAVDNKVLIDGISATQLKVSHISDTEFHQKVVDGTLDKNEIYVVSSQNINAFDERITNVKAPELSSDAATKSYVDETVKGSQSKLDTLSTYTHALSVSQLVWDIDVINCGTAK